jgi:hypothetical protein
MIRSHATAALQFGLTVALVLVPLASCGKEAPLDDAGGKKPSDFPELAEDVFAPMDGGIALAPDEIKGRNTWNLWCGGNEQFWDRMARESYGLVDVLKTLDSRKRGERFKDLGLINEPGYRQATKPDQYGLWLDEAEVSEPASIKPEVFGRSSGVMGFRLFPNPEFKGDAVAKWDPKRFYDDPDYGVRPDLVRPYRVGVACGSCHIAFNPCNPPTDPVNPKWENLASAIGNQYIREGPVFAPLVKDGGLFAEMFKTQPPGTSDTSRIATDHINNPNAINPIFELGARLSMASEEKLDGESLRLPNSHRADKVPHILKDGADSVGVPGATLRVYINIGMYSQHWLEQHDALIGLEGQKPFSIEAAQEKSVYWMSTQEKVGNIAKFFSRLRSFHLADAPGGSDYMTKDPKVLERGKLVFAENCAECHSSKRPPHEVAAAIGDVHAAESHDDVEWFKQAVLEKDFDKENFFSDDKPHSLKEIGTNAARTCGTNAKRGHIWANFSSDTYKERKSPGEIQVWNPYTEKWQAWQVPDGGSGYYRTPSLVCLWSSAPFLHNNALGKFNGDPSVAGRMAAFEDACEKLLWPDKRLGPKSIWRTTKVCNLQIQAGVIPAPLRKLLEVKDRIDPDGYYRIGPIPEGTPINLLANLDPGADPTLLVPLCLKIKATLLRIQLEKLDADEAKELMRKELAADLFAASKCPDLIEDRGHTFGKDLADDDKHALIEYLKTL